jgi:HEAT repeat protein
MSDTLKEREKNTPDGMKLWAPVPPPHEALQEVKGYGDKAVPILAEYLKSGPYPERELAMQFLSHISGSRIVEPLLLVIRYDPEPTLREDALAYLANASWKEAAPILKEASKVDPDPRVREKAVYLIMGHGAREVKSPPEGFIRKRIAALMAHILKKGEAVTSDGIKVATRALPSNEDIEEIKRYGDTAVPILSEYLTAEESREKNLAMRFLGVLGGSRIVEPLRKIALYDSSPAMRDLALRWLTTAPWDIVAPIIKQAMEFDSDPQVREAAKNILASYAPK